MKHISLLLLRVGLGALLLTHGFPKLKRLFSGEPIQFREVLGMSPEVSLALATFAEAFCSVLVIIGLATRYTAIPPAITMLVVAFVVHGSDPFGRQELPLLYLLGFVVVILNGGGKYSVDHWLARRNRPFSNTADRA